ncbi:phosphotransferase, partial [Myxococcota bacterium]|nr:phosphotransferase [Myxococcota bacterium]
DAALRAHTRAIDAAPTSLFARPTLRLCHGDLRPANTRVVAGGVVLLDFEHAGVGDPALDLAMLEARGGLGADEHATFVEHYAARSDDPHVTARLALLAPLVALTAALGAVLDLDDEERGLAAFAPDARRGAERRASVEAELSAALERSTNPGRRASRARRKDDRPWHP